jgi:hypothetical protein
MAPFLSVLAALLTAGFRLLYPISWALSEGSNTITNDAEQIFYSILDTLSQGVFAIALLALTRTLDFDLLHLAFTEYGRIRERFAGQEEKRGVRPDSGVAEGVVTNEPAGTTHGAYTGPTAMSGTVRP